MRYVIVSLLFLTMVLVPYSINGNAPLYILFISFLSVLGIFLKIPGAEFLLIAIALCLPAGWIGTTGFVFPEVDSMKSVFKIFTHFIIPLISYFLIRNNQLYNKKRIQNLIVGLLFVGFFSSLLTFNKNELIWIIGIIGYSYSFMLICFFDKKIGLKNAFLYLDVLFFISLVYGISEYFFRVSPYQYITDATTSFSDIGRARGILGHPLYLSGLALLYQSIIFIRYILFKRFGYIQEFLCVTMALIVVSRTTIIVMLLQYILFILYSKGFKSIKFWIGNALCLFIGAVLIFKYADFIVIDIITRFVEGNANHRESAFETVFLLFQDNPFGVGYSNIMEEIRKGGYATSGFLSDFSTVDNLFLSQLAAYGVFSVLKIAYYFYFLFDAYKYRKEYPTLFKSVLFLFFPFLFESFSFDWDTSPFLCMLLYGFIGYLYSYCRDNSCVDSDTQYSMQSEEDKVVTFSVRA